MWLYGLNLAHCLIVRSLFSSTDHFLIRLYCNWTFIMSHDWWRWTYWRGKERTSFTQLLTIGEKRCWVIDWVWVRNYWIGFYGWWMSFCLFTFGCSSLPSLSSFIFLATSPSNNSTSMTIVFIWSWRFIQSYSSYFLSCAIYYSPQFESFIEILISLPTSVSSLSASLFTFILPPQFISIAVFTVIFTVISVAFLAFPITMSSLGLNLFSYSW